MYNNLSKTVCRSPEDGLKIVNYYDCKLVMIKKLCSRKILISPNLIILKKCVYFTENLLLGLKKSSVKY